MSFSRVTCCFLLWNHWSIFKGFSIKEGEASPSATGRLIQVAEGVAGVDVFASESSNDSGVEHQITFYSIFLPKKHQPVAFQLKIKTVIDTCQWSSISLKCWGTLKVWNWLIPADKTIVETSTCGSIQMNPHRCVQWCEVGLNTQHCFNGKSTA